MLIYTLSFLVILLCHETGIGLLFTILSVLQLLRDSQLPAQVVIETKMETTFFLADIHNVYLHIMIYNERKLPDDNIINYEPYCVSLLLKEKQSDFRFRRSFRP